MKVAVLTAVLAFTPLTNQTNANAKPKPICYAKQIIKARTTAWNLQDSYGLPRYRTEFSERRKEAGCRFLRWVRDLWVSRTHTLQRLSDPVVAIRFVFGGYAGQALAVASCESHLSPYASNGQYKGMFQMGDYARARYGHSSTALGQARAAYRYFADSGRDWSPWECKP